MFEDNHYANLNIQIVMKKQKKDKKRKEMKEEPKKPFEPLIMLRVHYKKKKISLPLCSLPEVPLKSLLQPYLIRFEKQILSSYVSLENSNLDLSRIQNWKTVNKDIIKDYYFQLSKSLEVFAGEVLEIEPIYSKIIRDKISLSDFEIIKCIGAGGFSKVYLARKNNNGKFYAIKLMDKYHIYQFNKKIIVENERMIMVDLDHPFIVKLYAAFETKYFIAFVMECISSLLDCPGGQLFYNLRYFKRMNQQQARFYFIQILLGIQYLHQKNIIYRDLKPQNIFFDCQGHLKIGDFGLSKPNMKRKQKTYTFCGSPQYMPPQMIKNQGHSYQADYYCLGALLFQLIIGVPPFYSKDTNKIKEAILTQEINFPDHINLSNQLEMLLQSLLAKNPNHRLGSMKGIREILSHPWLRKLKWSEVLQKKIKPPFKPDLLTFNFDQNQIGDDEAQFTSLLLNHQSQTINSSQELFKGLYFNSNNESIEVQQELPLEPMKIKKDKKTSSNLKGRKSRQKIIVKNQQRNRTRMQRLNNLKKEGIQVSLNKKKNHLTRVKSAQHIKKIK